MKKSSFGTKAILALSCLTVLTESWFNVTNSWKGSSINQVNQTNIELCKLWVNLVWVKNLILSSSSSVGREWEWRSGHSSHMSQTQTEYRDEPVSSKSSKTCKSSSVFSVLVHTPLSAHFSLLYIPETYLFVSPPNPIYHCLTKYVPLQKKNPTIFLYHLSRLTSWPLLISSSQPRSWRSMPGAKVREDFFWHLA